MMLLTPAFFDPVICYNKSIASDIPVGFPRGSDNITGGYMIPYIDYSLCVGCEACAKIYPMFFMMKNDLPWVINHEKFIFEEHKDVPNCCPFRAITIE
jgi:ferredoxin